MNYADFKTLSREEAKAFDRKNARSEEEFQLACTRLFEIRLDELLEVGEFAYVTKRKMAPAAPFTICLYRHDDKSPTGVWCEATASASEATYEVLRERNITPRMGRY